MISLCFLNFALKKKKITSRMLKIYEVIKTQVETALPKNIHSFYAHIHVHTYVIQFFFLINGCSKKLLQGFDSSK